MAKAAPSTPKGGLQMKRAWKLYDDGNVVAARKEAETVLAQPGSESDAAEARDLLERTRVPKQALLFAAIAAALILGLIALAALRS